MKKIVKALLGGFIVSMVLTVLFPSAFLKDDALWTFQSNVGRVDVAFAGDVQDGCLKVHGDNVQAYKPKWLLDNRHNQGAMVSFPVSYLKKTYKITLEPLGNAREMSLEMNFRGQDLRIRNQRKPAYVRFENVRLNGQVVAWEKTVCHDKPFKYSLKSISNNSNVSLSFKIRKPISSSDIKWGTIIGLFIVVVLLIFYFGTLRRLGNKVSTFMEKKDVVQRNVRDGTQRLYAVEFLRIFFILCILFFHATAHTEIFHRYLPFLRSHRLWQSVDFFFILGGFFLFRNLCHRGGKTVFQRIQKLWWRLVPGLGFAFVLLCVIDKGVSWHHFTICLFNVPSVGLAPALTGWGDYFIGSYFLISCLLISLFTYYRRPAWLFIGIACYLFISLQLHVKTTPSVNASGGVYFSLIGYSLVRGFIGMSMGTLGAFLSENIKFPRRFGVRLAATAYEGLALFILLGYLMIGPENIRFTPLEIELTFTILLVSIAHNLGYISSFLNRLNWVMYVSRYTYSLLVAQIVSVRCVLVCLSDYFLSTENKAIIMIGGGILLAIIEYHLVENFLVPMIRTYLNGESTKENLEKTTSSNT